MKALLGAVVAVVVTLATVECSSAATGNPAVDALIEKLVQKRIITRDDAREIEKDLVNPAGGGTGTLTEPEAGSVKLTEPAQEAQTMTAKEAKEPSKLKLPFELKVRMQGRLDHGDLLIGPDGRYKTETDLFLRRVRLEVDKEFKAPPLGKKLDLDLTLDADRFDQDFRHGRRRNPGNNLDLHYLYGDWIFSDAFGLEIGKHKQPFLRAELTSSSRQLLIERPASDGEANNIFGGYHQTQIMVHGAVAGGAVKYYAAYADGTANLNDLQDLDSGATTVQKQGWGKAFIGRMEISPFGVPDGRAFIETKKDDTGIGGENHLTLGIDGGFQQDIKYQTASTSNAGLNTRLISFDLAGRYTFGAMGTLTGQMEYINFKRDFNYKQDETPQAGYIQAGYLLPWTLLKGRWEPAVRYELFDHDRIINLGESGTKERTLSIGLNHYLLKHSIKWSYNFVHTRFGRGVAETVNARDRDLHQLLLQLYF